MKAAYLETTGGPEVINYGDLPMPEPKAGEVRVRVGAASLNPIDTYIRSGMVAMNLPKPFIPGCDLAGTVEAVGSGADRFKIGDRVWGSNQGLLGRQGTFAEFACVHEDFLYSTPANVPIEKRRQRLWSALPPSRALPLREVETGRNRFRQRRHGRRRRHGRSDGPRRSAPARSPRSAQPIKPRGGAELGADCVINYKNEDVVAKIKEFTGGKGVNVWYETQAPTDLDKTIDALAACGRIVVMAGRAARPASPMAPLRQGTVAAWLRHVQHAAGRTTPLADDINRWMSEKKPLAP